MAERGRGEAFPWNTQAPGKSLQLTVYVLVGKSRGGLPWNALGASDA